MKFALFIHKSLNYKFPKRNKNCEVNIVDDITEDVYDLDLCVVIYKVNLVKCNIKE